MKINPKWNIKKILERPDCRQSAKMLDYPNKNKKEIIKNQKKWYL